MFNKIFISFINRKIPYPVKNPKKADVNIKIIKECEFLFR